MAKKKFSKTGSMEKKKIPQGVKQEGKVAKGKVQNGHNIKGPSESASPANAKQKGKDMIRKRKLGENDAAQPNPKKMKTEKPENKSEQQQFLKKKQRKKLRQKAKNKFYELALAAKHIWENLRKEDCPDDKRAALLNDLMSRVKGHVKQLIFAHDTSRVIECLMQYGSPEHRTMLFEELKDDIIPLSMSRYSKFFVIKVLKYGTKEQRLHVMKCFHGKVVKLLKHSVASSVVECAYNEYANATQRAELVQEVYGPNFALFKDQDCRSLGQILEKEPSLKDSIINHMKEALLKMVDKTVIQHSIVHHLLYEFFVYADAQSRAEVLSSICDAVPEILHTKEGAKVAAHCVWHGTAKDRKVIIRSMKTFVTKIAKEEHGHLVLLAIFDSVDDTKLVEKIILSELMKNSLEIVQDQYGRKVLWYLVSPRDPKIFFPAVVNFLKQGDNNESSKKDSAVRRKELQAAASPTLLSVIENHIKDLINSNSIIILVVAILNHASGDPTNAYKAIAELLKEPYFPPSGENYHFIENPGTHFLLKKLILDDTQRKEEKTVFFSSVLVESIDAENLATWIGCNRGAFLLLSLLETGIEDVVRRTKEALGAEIKSALKKKDSKGATLLLEKLKKL